MKVFDTILDTVGGTPLVELHNIERKYNLKARILAKVESFNPGGSVKDRIAKAMIEEAERSRQYEKFVKDRLAGYQAWKNTLEAEQKLYNEISSSVDKEYFENYNNQIDLLRAFGNQKYQQLKNI